MLLSWDLITYFLTRAHACCLLAYRLLTLWFNKESFCFYGERFIVMMTDFWHQNIKLFFSAQLKFEFLSSCLLQSILTSTIHWGNRVNLCLISEDGALEGIIDQPGSSCLSYVMVCTDICAISSLAWMEIWNNICLHTSFLFWMLTEELILFQKHNIKFHTRHTYCIWDLLRKYQTHTHTWLLTNTDFSLYFVSGSSGALKHWSISPQVSCERHTVV